MTPQEYDREMIRRWEAHEGLVKALQHIWAIADNTPATEGQTDQIQEVAAAALAALKER